MSIVFFLSLLPRPLHKAEEKRQWTKRSRALRFALDLLLRTRALLSNVWPRSFTQREIDAKRERRLRFEQPTRKYSALLNSGDLTKMFDGKVSSTAKEQIANETKQALERMDEVKQNSAGKADGPTARNVNRTGTSMAIADASVVETPSFSTKQARPMVSIPQQTSDLNQEKINQAQLLLSEDIYFSPVDATGGSVGLSSPLDIPREAPTQHSIGRGSDG